MKALSVIQGGIFLENISNYLKEKLQTRGISLDQLAQLSGVSEEVLKNLDTNQNDLQVSDLQKISNALNISFQIGDTAI